MKIKKLTVIFLLILPFSYAVSENSAAPFVIWAHSDIQPKKNNHINDYIAAVDDIASEFNYIDIAITAGDIVEKKKADHIYRAYLKTRKKINAGGWFEIAGNHEWRNVEAYKEIINKNLHYSVRTGNLLLIFMSNSERGQMTVIPDHIFEWWKKKVTENQDRIIITVTHASLKHSGLIQSKMGLKRQFIKKSKRFEKVLKKYRVDLWISGHSHFPGYLPYTDYKNDKLGGTVFIDIGAIRKDFMAGIESRLLYLYPGSDRLIIKHRDHEDGKFNDSREEEYSLSKIFIHNKNDRIYIDDIP